MEIKIIPFKKNLKYIKFLEDNFEEKKDYSLLENKTIVVNILDLKKNILGTICLLDNKHLMKFLEDTNPDATNNYVLRAAKGIHIYNFAVNKKNRKNKIGNKIINICLYIVKNLGYEYCHCHVDNNSISQKMFYKFGFVKEHSIYSLDNSKEASTKNIEPKKRKLDNMTYWV
jgi:ribosomal protein S18 acetylase RimI-like enzyme